MITIEQVIFLYTSSLQCVFMKEKILSQCKSDKVVLAGDGRCDSPGLSAKYCS